MIRTVSAIVGALFLGATSSPPAAQAQAQAQMMCGDHAKVVENLQDDYSETLLSLGIASNGAVVEVYTSPEGTWTVLMTQANGMSCLVAMGENWEVLQTQTAHVET